MSPAKKQLIINAFAMQAPGHLNPGLFKYPADKGSQYNNIKHWQALAQKLEAAKFHAIFFADVLGGYDVYKGTSILRSLLLRNFQSMILYIASPPWPQRLRV
jgi:alkanesulfonate monooxygenase SsuD/methylene tetrahydromethanopterin reductase-like flavin-dependent oxidoreductase (luciferase family)